MRLDWSRNREGNFTLVLKEVPGSLWNRLWRAIPNGRRLDKQLHGQNCSRECLARMVRFHRTPSVEQCAPRFIQKFGANRHEV
jgi:hypothetical protein